MKKKLGMIVEGIKEKTGIDLDIYNMLGEKLATTNGLPMYKYIGHGLKDFGDGFFIDERNDMTYFLVGSDKSNLIGVIKGCDMTSKNYGFMLSSLVETAIIKSDINFSRNDTFKSILLGDVKKENVHRDMTKYSVPTKSCYVLSIVCPKDNQGEILNLLSQFCGGGDITVVIDENVIGYIKFYEKDEDFQSSIDFAESLNQSILAELNITVKIGVGSSVKDMTESGVSFMEAQAALRMGGLLSEKQGIHSYKDYMMLRMIDDIPKPILKKYLDALIDSGVKEVMSDAELVQTAEEFLSSSLNISETARVLYMHRNTLLYRLDKIEKAMGLNIRRFSDAVTFRIITILYKLLKL